MHKEKSIEDILESIFNLVSEAKRESELITNQQTQKIISTELKSEVDPQGISETSRNVLKELQKKKHTMENWEEINFDKNAILRRNIKTNNNEEINNEITKNFEERVKIWSKKNLKQSFEKEFYNHTNKILKKKLK